VPDSHSFPNRDSSPSAQDLAESVSLGFAADLHDDLVPLLFVARQSLLNQCEQIQKFEPPDSAESSSLPGLTGDAFDVLQDHVENLRQIEAWLSKAMEVSRGLIRQAHLEEEELLLWWDALQRMIDSLYPDEDRVTWIGQPPNCPSPIAKALYRIAGEALRNAIRHSGAKCITAKWESAVDDQETPTPESRPLGDRRTRMSITDDGVGFDPKTVGKDRFGLAGIRMRAALVGLPLTIQSEPGGPTTITVDVRAG